uniref:EF-hand domain-containing protein n=1 Tax=Kalanchoe fedtschenkoi TaxID=63787 RepID=A0A7N0V5T4_KALFE
MEKRVQYESVFNHFDENGDGKLSPSELQQCVTSMGGELALSEAESVVGALDSDGDGLLGLEDFLKFVNGGEEEEKAKVMVEAFNMYKMEGCEWITAVSLRRMLGKLGQRMTVEECGKVIRVFDLNGDGVLNFDEFRNMMG